MSVSAASRAGPMGRDPADVGRLFADAPCGTCPCDRVSSGPRPRIQTARAWIRIHSPLVTVDMA
eukprot:7620407-Pyramimonas_sp.AAC.1